MYPVNVTAESVEGPRSRGLALAGVIFFFKWLLLLPHLFILGLISSILNIVAWVGYVIVLFTGQMPDGLRTFFGGYLRWNARVYAWGAGVTDAYPPFTFDAGGYDVDYEEDVPDSSSRGLAALGAFFFLKAILLIPHFIVLVFLYIALWILMWVGYIVVLFTGNLPEFFGNFYMGVIRWSTRIYAWFFGLTDAYPPFSME